jgi:hypothetical protein
MPVDGTYHITLGTGQGEQPGTLTLESAGTALSGSFTGPQGTQAFDGGSVSGNEVKWSATVSSGMGEMTIDFDGVVDGDDIVGSLQIRGSFGYPFKGSRV